MIFHSIYGEFGGDLSAKYRALVADVECLTVNDDVRCRTNLPVLKDQLQPVEDRCIISAA